MNYDMLTISVQNGSWVRYENFPIHRNFHVLDPVWLNGLRIISGQWHCRDCNLMGTETTMQEYACHVQAPTKNRIQDSGASVAEQLQKSCSQTVRGLGSHRSQG